MCLVMVLGVCTVGTFAAEAEYTYKLDEDGNAVITGLSKTGTVSTIPSTIASHKVVAIGDYAFSDPEYKNFTDGTTLTIPEGVVSIGEGAFEYCTSVTTLKLPKSLKYIAPYAFFSCRSLTQINLSGTSVQTIGEYAFKLCEKVTKVMLPNTVEKLGMGVFSYNTSLTDVTLPYSVRSVAKNAFLNCKVMTKATILNSECVFGDRVFDITDLKNKAFTISGYSNSTANTYANNKSYKFVPLDEFNCRTDLEKFVKKYLMVETKPNSYCYADTLLPDFLSTFTLANNILNNHAVYSEDRIESTANKAVQFKPDMHSMMMVNLSPSNEADGKESFVCSLCGKEAGINVKSNGIHEASFDHEPLVIPAPSVCSFKTSYYDYTYRAASLKFDRSEDSQMIRFPASVKVPENVEVVDFGFVFTQTKYLNGGEEPADNGVYNNDLLVEGTKNVYKYSVRDEGNFTIHDGNVYTFNLVINVNKENWASRYAAKSFITYKYKNKEYTVMDDTYASRSVIWVAEQVVHSPYENQIFKDLFNSKMFG